MAREFTFRGKTVEELKVMDSKEFMNLLKARERRSMKRGLTEAEKKLDLKIRKALEGKHKKPIKTHCREMVVTPEMIGLTIYVHKGKGFTPVMIIEEMVGHRLGEMTETRTRLKHSAPGVGATKSSAAASVK